MSNYIRIVSFILIIVFALCLPSCSKNDDKDYEYFEEGDFKICHWKSSDTYAIAGYTGNSEHVIVPGYTKDGT